MSYFSSSQCNISIAIDRNGVSERRRERERRADEIKKKDLEKKFLADVHDKFFQFLKLVA